MATHATADVGLERRELVRIVNEAISALQTAHGRLAEAIRRGPNANLRTRGPIGTFRAERSAIEHAIHHLQDERDELLTNAAESAS